MASSRRRFEPQRSVTQSGISRSVSPAMLRRDTRLWDCRNRGSVVESLYLSANIVEGRVMNECKLQACLDAMAGGDRACRGMKSFKVGCKPVGWEKLVSYVADSGRGWCREGDENSVGSAREFNG